MAVRLGLVQRTACGEQPRFALRRLHQPENCHLRRLALRCSGHVVTVPFARAIILPACRPASAPFELLLDTEGVGGGEHEAFLCKQSGKLYCHSCRIVIV
jgi:hypothetical protein